MQHRYRVCLAGGVTREVDSLYDALQLLGLAAAVRAVPPHPSAPEWRGAPIDSAPRERPHWIWLKSGDWKWFAGYWDGEKFVTPGSDRRETIVAWSPMTANELASVVDTYGNERAAGTAEKSPGTASNTVSTGAQQSNRTAEKLAERGEDRNVAGITKDADGMNWPWAARAILSLHPAVLNLQRHIREPIADQIAQALRTAYAQGRAHARAGMRKDMDRAQKEAWGDGTKGERERCMALAEALYESYLSSTVDRSGTLMLIRALLHDIERGAQVQE